MAEVKSGIPTFSFLQDKKIVRQYKTFVECGRNPLHGKYETFVKEFEDFIKEIGFSVYVCKGYL